MMKSCSGLTLRKISPSIVSRTRWPQKKIDLSLRALSTSPLITISTANGVSLGGSTISDSPLPPFKNKNSCMINVSQDITVVRQEFGPTNPPGGGIFLNCFVVKLQDESLLVYSPPAMTEECDRLFNTLQGEVKHIVFPNSSPEHWMYAPEASKKWPSATLWVCPGCVEGSGVAGVLDGAKMWQKLSETHLVKTIQDGSPPELFGDIEFVVFKESLGLFAEVTTHLTRYNAIVLADFGFSRSEPEILKTFNLLDTLALKIAGIHDRLGSPAFVLMFLKDRAAANLWLETVQGWKDWDKVFCLHYQPILLDARPKLAECFSFLQEKNNQE